MTDGKDEKLTLNTAATRYLTQLRQQGKESAQQEIPRFVRWFGEEKPVSGLRADEVVDYADHFSAQAADYTEKIEIIKAFLKHLKRQGWLALNLAVCLKPRKTRARVQSQARKTAKAITLTREGYKDMKTELAKLKEKRLEIIEDIRRAAADKDLSENAPYHAAREQKAQLDGRIIELEATLTDATITQEKLGISLKTNVGDMVILKDLESNETFCYTLVHPREVDPAQGKISTSSPIGKAVIGHGAGDVFEVTLPSGEKLHCRIERLGK